MIDHTSEPFGLLRFESRGSAVRALSEGTIRSIYYETDERTPEFITERAKRAGVMGLHGLVRW